MLDGDARALVHAVARFPLAAPPIEEAVCTLFGRARERDVAALLEALRGMCALALRRLAVAVVLEGGDGDGDIPIGEVGIRVGKEEEGLGGDKVERDAESDEGQGEDAEDGGDEEDDDNDDDDDDEYRGADGGPPLSFGAIAPALGCGGLTALELALGAPLRLGAAELARCTQAWPAMRTLELEVDLAP